MSSTKRKETSTEEEEGEESKASSIKKQKTETDEQKEPSSSAQEESGEEESKEEKRDKMTLRRKLRKKLQEARKNREGDTLIMTPSGEWGFKKDCYRVPNSVLFDNLSDDEIIELSMNVDGEVGHVESELMDKAAISLLMGCYEIENLSLESLENFTLILTWLFM